MHPHNKTEIQKLILNKVIELDKKLERYESEMNQGFIQMNERFDRIEDILKNINH